MDFSKAFDTINHELLIAKLNAYGFSEPSLRLIYNYIKDWLQHIKINSTFSEWSELIQRVPEKSVLGPLLFNTYLNDLFYIPNDVDICIYADDTTPNVCNSSLKVVIEKPEKSSQLAIKWFNHNYIYETKCWKMWIPNNWSSLPIFMAKCWGNSSLGKKIRSSYLA